MPNAFRWTPRFAQAGLALVTLAATGCTTTSLVNMWKDPASPGVPLHSVLVVTIRRDPTSRRVWEDGFVAELKKHGIVATPSYTLFPNAPPDTTALADAVRGKGYDAVLAAHQLPTSTDTHYVPGYLATEPVTLMSPWTGHYYTYLTDVYAPGHVETDRVVRYESEVWTTAGAGKLIWTGATESINPSSADQVHKEIANVIVPAIVKSGVMGSR